MGLLVIEKYLGHESDEALIVAFVYAQSQRQTLGWGLNLISVPNIL